MFSEIKNQFDSNFRNIYLGLAKKIELVSAG